MESFVSTLVTDMSSTSVAFLSTVVTSYWGIILSIGFVGFIMYKFLRLARMR